MSGVARLSFSIEKSLLDRLEKLVKEGRYENRSEFIRDLIRGRLVEQEWEHDKEAVGTITMLYDHHRRGLSEKLTEVQHGFHHDILASTHIHLYHALCAEIVIVRGRASRLKELVALLRRHKGVLHAALSISSTGKKLT